MKKDLQGLRIEDIENAKIHKLDATDENLKALGIDKNSKEKSVSDYIIEYVGKKDFDRIHKVFINTLDKSGEKIKIKCKYCATQESNDENDKLCKPYHTEAMINKHIAELEFVSVIEQNKHFFQNKEQLRNVTYSFYESFNFKEWRVYFSTRTIFMNCLNYGLITIADILQKSKHFERMSIIKDSTHSLEMQNLEHKIKNGEENEIFSLQLDFFNSKKKFYKETHKLEKIKKSENLIEDDNIYPFFSIKTKQLFEEFIKENFTPSDIIYIYRKMYEEKYLTLEPSVFLSWINEHHSNIGDFKMKTIHEIGNLSKRNTIYRQLKKQIGVK